jgi:hypothetical protein
LFHRELLIALAARYQLPAVYPYRFLGRPAGTISPRQRPTLRPIRLQLQVPQRAKK